MLSLVGDYGSSEEEDETTDDSVTTSTTANIVIGMKSSAPDVTEITTKSKYIKEPDIEISDDDDELQSPVPAGGGSSSNICNSVVKGPMQIQVTNINKKDEKYLNPEKSSTIEKDKDKYDNPFRSAGSSSIFKSLKKYEPPVFPQINEDEGEDKDNQDKAKKICWNYRKGKCIYGDECEYFHESTLIPSVRALKAAGYDASAFITAKADQIKQKRKPEDEDDAEEDNKPKFRPKKKFFPGQQNVLSKVSASYYANKEDYEFFNHAATHKDF